MMMMRMMIIAATMMIMTVTGKLTIHQNLINLPILVIEFSRNNFMCDNRCMRWWRLCSLVSSRFGYCCS